VLAGAALLYGDGVITPAISVLSAAEGLEVIHPDFKQWTPEIAACVLFFLFYFQHHGTHKIGAIFGPIMLVWFLTIGLFGAAQIIASPSVFQALSPHWGVYFLCQNPSLAAGILGSVVLVVTGAEALYADMGHFGRKNIACAWIFIAFPCLVLSYFGQGAYVLGHPGDGTNPFFAIAPEGVGEYYLVGISFLATIIASQALITGVFSLTRQAIQLGYFPRLKVIHTNAGHEGQIYLPAANWALAVGTLVLVFGFQSSEKLAAAYGIAVTGTMFATTCAFYSVIRYKWGWSLPKAISLCAVFWVIDFVFFFSNIHKIPDGGWLPLVAGAALLAVMHTWKTGRAYIASKVYASQLDPGTVIEDIERNKCFRSPGTAVFMAGRPESVPVILLHHLKCNRCVHETVILLSFCTEEVPHVETFDRFKISELGSGFWRVVVPLGYMQSPHAVRVLRHLVKIGFPISEGRITYFFNREIILTTGRSPLMLWQKQLYTFLSRNALPAPDNYRIPPNQIVEMGLPVQI